MAVQTYNPPRPATGVSWALRARSVPGVSLGVFLGPFGPQTPECPRSVKNVSGTLFGHSGVRGPKGSRDNPRDTPGTLRARRARETPVAGWGGGCKYRQRKIIKRTEKAHKLFQHKSGMAPANQTKERSAHELFTGAFRNKSSICESCLFS